MHLLTLQINFNLYLLHLYCSAKDDFCIHLTVSRHLKTNTPYIPHSPLSRKERLCVHPKTVSNYTDQWTSLH